MPSGPLKVKHKSDGNPYSPGLYGESFADVYDDWYSGVSDADAFAEFVYERCGDRRVLELGVGSGRLALPLCKMGTTVVGLDASESMINLCGESPEGRLLLLRADIRALPFDSDASFDGVVIGFNTIFNLVTEADQQRLFADARRLLRPGGYLIIEATNQAALDQEQQSRHGSHSFGVTRHNVDSVVVASTTVDPGHQVIDGCHIEFDSGGVRLRPWKLRWLSSEQMDELARAEQMPLAERYASWAGDALTAASVNHVSVYQRPE